MMGIYENDLKKIQYDWEKIETRSEEEKKGSTFRASATRAM